MRSEEAGEIAARWLPKAQFSERHAAVVAGRPEDILQALKTYDPQSDRIVRAMMKLREAPSRLWAALGGKSAIADRPPFGLHNFTLLEESKNGVAYALAGRFWRHDYGGEKLDSPEAFASMRKPGTAKLVMAYSALPRPDGLLDLVTETRVYCPDTRSLILFTPYWAAIRLGSGFIRRRILAYASRPLPQAGEDIRSATRISPSPRARK